MELLTGKEAARRVRGFIHEKFQVHRYAVHLTAKTVHSLMPSGRVDFSGSDFTPAGRIAIQPVRTEPEDRYGWWDLGRGSYLVETNEVIELAEDEMALVQPEDRLLRAGATHPTLVVRGRAAPLQLLLSVETLRLELRQNARISRLTLFRIGAGTRPRPKMKARARARARKKPKRR